MEINGRTVEEHIAAIDAGMTMGGYVMTEKDIALLYELFHGEISEDEATLRILEELGCEDSLAAQTVRSRIMPDQSDV